MRRNVPFYLGCVLGGCVLGGCVQLVAFDQAIIGQPDYTGPRDQATETLCEDAVDMGGSALCSETCEIEGEETTCGDRVEVRDGVARVNVAGLREVEVTVSWCPTEARAFELTQEGRASIVIEGRALAVGVSEQPALLRRDTELPADDCAERTLILQTGRLGLLDAGRRVCSDQLPRLDTTWTIATHGDEESGVRNVELCFREPT